MWRIAFLVLVFMFAFALAAQNKDNFDPTRATQLGCKIDQIASDGRWHVDVWADYGADKKAFNLLYSIREPKERSKAFSDCDKWMGEKQKETEKAHAKPGSKTKRR